MRLLLFIASCFLVYEIEAQLIIDNTILPTQLVEDHLLGQGLSAYNVTTAGHPRQMGTFTNSNSNLQLSSGIFLATGFADDFNNIATNNNSGFTSIDYACSYYAGGICQPGDADLDFFLGGQLTSDAAVLEFDFVPEADTVLFRYVFASEEYNEFVCSNFNDVFAFIVSGPNFPARNIARLPNSSLPVSINTVNNGQGSGIPCEPPVGSLGFSNFFIDNTGGDFVEFDGMTVPFEAIAVVNPCDTYHIKLVVADVGDSAYDTGVFLEAGSFSSTSLQASATNTSGDSIIAEGCATGEIVFSLDGVTNTDYVIPYTVSGTAINGVDYDTIGGQVVIPQGSSSASIIIEAFADSIIEGPETIVITYPLDRCNTNFDSITVEISEEVILEAPEVDCESIQDGVINFTWTDVPGATGYEVSLDGGQTWQPASGLLQHNANRVVDSLGATIWVRALGGTPGCSPNEIDSVTCFDCGLEVVIDSVKQLSCNVDNDGAIGLLVTGGLTPYDFIWSNGATTEDVTGLETGTYSVTISDAAECESIVSAHIQTAFVPEVEGYIFESGMTSYSIGLGDEVMAGVESDQTLQGAAYLWEAVGSNIGDAGLITTEGAYTSMIPTENGVYRYQVIAYNDWFGVYCADTAFVELIVTGFLGIPNAFTPDGDGTNDRFRPIHLSAVEVLEFTVYNRWGEVVYNDPDISDGGWDGIYKNKEQPRDAYMYLIRFQQAGSNTEEIVRGEVLLIR